MIVTKSARFGGRCYPGERAALLAVARTEGRAASDVLRELIRERAQTLGLWPIVPTVGQANTGGNLEKSENGQTMQ